MDNSLRVRSQLVIKVQMDQTKKDKKTYVNTNLKSSGKMTDGQRKRLSKITIIKKRISKYLKSQKHLVMSSTI